MSESFDTSAHPYARVAGAYASLHARHTKTLDALRTAAGLLTCEISGKLCEEDADQDRLWNCSCNACQAWLTIAAALRNG